MRINWVLKSFNELMPIELYAIMQLRNKVFIVEQNCVYQDADNKDLQSYHLGGWDGSSLAAYARIIPPGVCNAQASIGRVVVAAEYRATGLGRVLMKESIHRIFDNFNSDEIQISAQLYLKRFYESLGFCVVGEPYEEDGIVHIAMCLKK